MKQSFGTAIIQLLLLVLLSNSCVEERVRADTKHIAFRVVSDNDELLTDLPPGSTLTINFESFDGDELTMYDEVKFERSTNGFVTTALTEPGPGYRIADCIIVNASDEIIYAAPKPNTLGSSLQSRRLSSERSNVELLDVRHHKPEDFGYTSFNNPNRGLKVVVTVEGSSKPVSAEAYLLNGVDTLQHYNLRAGLNVIHMPKRTQGNNRLVIQKRSYADYTIDLSAAGTKHNQYKKPLKIILEPAFKIFSTVYLDSEYKFSCEFYLGADESTKVTVDWGDGSRQTLTPPYAQNIYHEYAQGGEYTITVTGDLDRITNFNSFFDITRMRDVDFTHLTELTIIAYGFSDSPSIIDLTHNPKLKLVDLPVLDNLEKIYLPNNHRIDAIAIDGPNQMTTVSVDAVIDNLYRNTVANHTFNGGMTWAAHWDQEWDPEQDKSIVGPPSAVALLQVKIMKEKYGWTFDPDPFENGIAPAATEKIAAYKKLLLLKNVTGKHKDIN